ncbi:MAG: type IV pilus secretin PilQ [bacterium]
MSKRKLKCGSGTVLVITLFWIAAIALCAGCAAQKDAQLTKVSEDQGSLESVRVEAGDKEDKVILKVSPEAKYHYTIYKWEDPPRVVVDITGLKKGDLPNVAQAAQGLVKDIKVDKKDDSAEDSGENLRVIMSLKESAEYKAQKDENESLIVSLSKDSSALPAKGEESSGVLLVEDGGSLSIHESSKASENNKSGASEDEWVWSGPQTVEDENTATAKDKDRAASEEAVYEGGPAKKLNGININDQGDLARVELNMDGSLADYSAFSLQDPPRLVVDLWGMENKTEIAKKTVNEQGIHRVRVGQHPDKLRLVFDAADSMPNFRFDKGNKSLIVTFSKTVDVSATTEMPMIADTETSGAVPAGGQEKQADAVSKEENKGKESSEGESGASARKQMEKPESEDGWSVMQVAQEDEWGGLEGGDKGEQWTEPAPVPEEEKPAEEPAEEPAEDVDREKVPKPSESFDWGDKPQPPIVEGPGKPGIAYIDKVEFKYSEQASTISIHADRPLRREQWELHNNVDENVDEKVVTIFIYDAQLAEDQQKTFDTSEFSSPVEMFSAYQRPGEKSANEVAIVINLNSWAASKWDQQGHNLVLKFENTPGSLGIGGEPTKGRFGPQGEEFTGEDQAGYGPGEAEQYGGGNVSLNFKGVSIREVLAVLAESSGMNFVIDENVKATVTIKLDNVPWDQALDIILETYGLEKRKKGNILRVAPKGEFRKEQQEEFQQMGEERKYEPLEIKIIPINYLEANRMNQVVQQLLTPGRGKVQADRRTNSLVVMDRPQVLQQVSELVNRLDRPTKQVLIEVRMVEATTAVTREIGVRWGSELNLGPQTGTPTGMQFPNTIQFGGAVLGGSENAGTTAAASSSGGGALGLSVGHLTNAVDLDVTLRALEAQEKIKIISSPRILTLTDEKASIQQGISIPFPPPSTQGAGGMGWQFVEATLKLDVTPHVAEDGSITLDIQAQNNEPVTVAGSERPGVSTKEAQTTILLMDGETAVIGGIFKITERNPTTQVPFLGNLPYIGKLFKNEITESRKEELLIFLTPQIVKSGKAPENKENLQAPIKVGG